MATAGNIGKGETLLINIKTQYDGGVAQVGKEIEKQSKYASRYFNQLNKDWITLRESYKAFLQNKNDKGVASLNVPSNLLQQQKAQQRVFDKAQKAFKVYTDNQITSQEELNKLLNNTISQNITRLKEEQKALSQLSKLPTLTFRIREKGQTLDKTFEELVKDRIEKNSAFKLYDNIRNLIAGKKPENIQRGLNNFLPFPTVKEAKTQLKAESKKLTDLLTKQAKGEVVDTKAINELQQIVPYLQGLSDKNQRLDTIAKYLSTDKGKAKEIITKIKQDSTLAPIHALQKFRNNQSITPEQERMVAGLLNSNGISVEKTKEHFALSNNLGKYQRQLTTIQQLAKSFTQDETNLKNAQNELNKTNAEIAKQQTIITQQDINKGRRAYLQSLVNFTSRKNGSNYFSDLRQQILTEENIPDRKRRLEEYTKKTREIAGYATNVMQTYGLDPKLFAWNEKEFNQHLKEIREKNPGTINRKEARLINKLYRNIALDLVDENDLFKNRAIQQTNILPYFERFKKFDSEFLKKTAPVVPSKTTVKDIINLSAGFQQDLERTKGIQKNILSALNSYTGMNLKENFTQEDLNNQLKTATKLSTDEQKNVRELGQGYLIASKRANEFSEAITKVNNNLYANDINNLISDSKKYLNDFQKISKNPAFTNLLAGNKVEASAFIPIDILTKQIENLTNVTAKQLKTLGVEIAPKQANAVAENVFQRFERSSKYASFKPNEKQAYESLKETFLPLNSAYGDLHGASEVQLRRHSEQIKTEAQIQKQTQKDIMDDINQKNMSLYALSHALKSVEAPLMQGYETGKGSINEYVNFQSAMVGVAKLLPALRDKDTLVVNDKFTEFRQGILDLTETLPRSGIELAQASEVASRLGVTNPDQIRKVVEAGTKLGVAFGMAPNDVTSQIVKIANAKGIDVNKSDSMERIMEFADAINYLDDHTAASGREIINFTKKAVQTAEGVKMDTKDVSAFGASLVSLGISSDSANTAFKNLMTVLQTGPRNRKTGVEYLEKSGYSVKQLTTEFKKNPTKTAVEFIKRLNKLRNAPAGADAAAIVRFAFGQMSSQGIMALVNNPEVLEKYLKMARQDSKGWTEKEFKARQINDPIVRFQLLQNKIKSLQVDIGEALMPLADTFITNIKDMSKAIAPIVKENPQLIRNTAYAGLGLLSAVKIASLTTDIATIFNNLRHFKSFQKLADKWTHLKSLSPVIKSLSSGKQGWLGSLLSIPLGSAEGVAGWGGLTLGSVLGGTAIAGGIGTGIGLLLRQLNIADLWNWLGKWTGLSNGQQTVYLGNDKAVYQQEQKENIAQNKAQGIIADRQRRATAEHGSVYTEKRLEDIKYQIEKSGYKIHRNETGQIYLTKSKKDLKTGKMFDSGEAMEFGTLSDIQGEQRYLIPIKTKKDLMNLTGSLQRSDIEFNSNVLTENKNSELFALIDSLKYLDIQLQAQRRKEGIAPNIETIASIDDTNKKAYTQLRNKQIEKHKERASLETEKKLIDDKIANITSVDSSKIDLVQLGKYQQKLDEVTKKLKKVKTSQKYLRELLEYTDLATPNSIQDTINKNEVKKNKKSALINLTKMGASAITSALGVATSPSETTKFLFDQYSKAIEERNSLVPFKDNASWVQKLPKDIQDKGKKQYYEANDKQYSLGLQFSEATKNMQINDWLKFSNLSNQQSPLEQIFGINVQQLMDSANQKQELINKTMGLTMQNTVNLYGENEKVGKSFTSIQYSSQEAFNHLSQSASKTAKGIASDIGGALDEIYAKIELINSTTISPKVGKPITITISGGEGGGDSPPRKGYNKQE